jgi:hypothetical protein
MFSGTVYEQRPMLGRFCDRFVKSFTRSSGGREIGPEKSCSTVNSKLTPASRPVIGPGRAPAEPALGWGPSAENASQHDLSACVLRARPHPAARNAARPAQGGEAINGLSGPISLPPLLRVRINQ